MTALTVVSPGLAFLAGLLSILSPCVLPLIPIIFGTAQSRHKFGPFAVGAGLAISFTAIGLFVSTIGFSLGLDATLFRKVGGMLLVAFGVLLLMPRLQMALAAAGGPLTNGLNGRLDRLQSGGLGGQALLGALLGLVWVPCVGPTLGAASLLAAQGKDLGQAAAVMTAFGLGAATPLTVIGLISSHGQSRWRAYIRNISSGGKRILGISLLGVGTLILTGVDHQLEALLTEISPDWLVSLTTSY
ncbi:MAG: cytochrome c biogenesis CcdA family protein [Sphingomicrobium sp.]